MKEIIFSTKKKVEIIDITEEVEKVIPNIKEGYCLVFAPHATAAILLQENESGLIKDICNKVQDLFYGDIYLHNKIDNNAAAHIASALIGASKVIPIKDGKLVRGTWQNILFLELDGPRSKRRVVITVIESK